MPRKDTEEEPRYCDPREIRNTPDAKPEVEGEGGVLGSVREASVITRRWQGSLAFLRSGFGAIAYASRNHASVDLNAPVVRSPRLHRAQVACRLLVGDFDTFSPNSAQIGRMMGSFSAIVRSATIWPLGHRVSART